MLTGDNKAEYQRTYMRGYFLRRRQQIAEIKEAHPCADCGNFFPYFVMDFDHVRGSKEQAISRMIGCNIDRIMDEIDKCDLVCANCHRFRTHNRRNS